MVEKQDELAARANFLREAHAKVVEAPKRDKPKATEGAKRK